MFRALLSGSPDLDQVDRSGNTILHHAITRRDRELVALLIEKGADLNIADKQQRMPLALAMDADLAIAELLSEKGAICSKYDPAQGRSRYASMRKQFPRAAEEGYGSYAVA